MNAALQSELKRKSVHLVMGLFCMTLPWIFTSPWQVDLLAAVSVGILLLIRWLSPKFGNVLHGVQRLSFGELLFPIGVALVFRLSFEDLSTFLAAVGILTFGDTAGALIGKRFGKNHYHTNAGQKSVEGSLAVFLVSFLITFVCGISQDLITSLLISTVVGLVAMMAEGILGAGIDNLVLPLTVYGLLFFLKDLTWLELLSRIGIISALALFLFIVRRITSLNGGGLLSATVFGYLCYALGGTAYLLAPLLLFGIHLATTWFYPALRQLEHSSDSVAAVALPGLIWVSLRDTTSLPEATCYLGFCLTMITQVAFLHAATRAHLQKPPGTLVCFGKVFIVSLTCWHPLAIIPPIAARWLGKLNRVEQSILSFLFSLISLTLI